MRMLKIPEVARMLQVGETELYRMAKRGQIPSIRVGRRVRIPEDELLRWLKGRLRGSSNPSDDQRPEDQSGSRLIGDGAA